jgi:pyruvate dehydrogenase E2 component (dihydrolipoamide acetyltransferase)
MIVDVVMPRLSDTMTEGYIAGWHKAIGDQVTVGEDLVDIDTGKATVSHEAGRSGVLVELLAQVADVVKVGDPIARIEIV